MYFYFKCFEEVKIENTRTSSNIRAIIIVAAIFGVFLIIQIIILIVYRNRRSKIIKAMNPMPKNQNDYLNQDNTYYPQQPMYQQKGNNGPNIKTINNKPNNLNCINPQNVQVVQNYGTPISSYSEDYN